MATVTHKVVKGDTLSAIAKKYRTTVNAIAKLNNIKNVNLIYVGQVLYISGKPSTASTTSSTTSSQPNTTPSNVVSIWGFGLQSDSDRTLFIAWSWDRTNTDSYKVEWDYSTGAAAWFEGARNTVSNDTLFSNTYNVPSNAISVRVRIKPISSTYKDKNGNEISYWTASWCAYQTYDAANGINKPEPPAIPTPSAPEVTVDGYKLTCKVDDLNGIDLNEEVYVEFNVMKDDVDCVNAGFAKVIYFAASYSCTINPGHNYKVRARIKQGSRYGEWSNYSGDVKSIPYAPSAVYICRATSSTSALLRWVGVNSAESYDIEYATNKDYFNGSNATTIINNITTTKYEVTGLESGHNYFFRVRAVNKQGSSSWTSLVSVVIGTKPGPPSTWSSTTTAISGENLVFYWIHNCEDGSNPVRSDLEIYVDSVLISKTITHPELEDGEEQKTLYYEMDTTNIVEGAVIKWRVRTAGITQEYGDWSVQRTINVYAPPTLDLTILTLNNEITNVIESFPFKIRGLAGPVTQTPVSYYVSIIAKDPYEAVDELGNFKMVLANEEIYSGFYDISTNLDITMTPDKVDLQSDIKYDLRCVLSMNSGLSVEAVYPFTVSWIDEILVPNAEIAYDSDKYVTHVRPFCEYYPDIYYQVDYVNQQWVRTTTELPVLDGISVDNAFTTDDDIVYAGMYGNNLTHFCIVRSVEPVLVPDITLSVYRHEFDGTFTEIGKGLKNRDNTFVTDPHPPLDYVRYRIVAVSDLTGAISYTDLPGYPIQEKAIIIQWDEEWSSYIADNEGTIINTVWSGSLLRLPYNIDISETTDNDVSLIEYIGRKNPVSYYGTQVGSSATWNTAIPEYDTETIYLLRKLAIWMGDVYVREPSGTGYWANVSVSFSKTHRQMTIPVTINIKRVSGGV